ncbi:MAG: hypothetical protein ABJB10_13110 [Mesorhizobium sp.]
MDVTAAFANLGRRIFAVEQVPSAKLLISPLAEEMSGRTEGSVKELGL